MEDNKWRPFQEFNQYVLHPGTKIKFNARAGAKFVSKVGIVERSPSRSNQKRVACNIDGKSWGVPLTWISEFDNSQWPATSPMPPITRPSVKFGNFWNDAVPGDWCVFYRGVQHFDIVQFKKSTAQRVWCFNPLNNKTQGYKAEWFVCKLDRSPIGESKSEDFTLDEVGVETEDEFEG